MEYKDLNIFSQNQIDLLFKEETSDSNKIENNLRFKSLSTTENRINRLASFLSEEMMVTRSQFLHQSYSVTLFINLNSENKKKWEFSVKIDPENSESPKILRPSSETIKPKIEDCRKGCVSVFEHTYYHEEQFGRKKCQEIGEVVKPYKMLAVFTIWKGLLLSIDPRQGLKPEDYPHLFTLCKKYIKQDKEKLERICGSLLETLNYLDKKDLDLNQCEISWHVGFPTGSVDLIHTRITGIPIIKMYEQQCNLLSDKLVIIH